jgi:hypothetical protein
MIEKIYTATSYISVLSQAECHRLRGRCFRPKPSSAQIGTDKGLLYRKLPNGVIL